MKRQVVNDEFFDRQPPLEFVNLLRRPVHEHAPASFARKEARENEISVNGLFIDTSFPDPKGLLETMYEDFARFLSVCKIDGNRYPVRIIYGETPCFEAYSINVTEEACVITAADTEGVRRALVYLEDEMTAREGAFLPLGKIERKPWMRDRLTRGFFSPTNRPPKNGDELSDDVEYYPDEYLNRLAHDGTNGLWIYTSFRQLFSSNILPEYDGKDSERRIEKLNRVIARCARYGVRVYVFAIEPLGFSNEMAEKYPDMINPRTGYGAVANTLCPYSERVQAYCREAGARLFTLCPDLAGLISITAGERPTACSSTSVRNCAHPCTYTRGEILAKNIENLSAGMREVKPDAKLVSWTYGHRNWQDSDIADYIKGAPNDVALMQNFDDRGFAEQLGVERQAMDYWLSYVGPSELFEMTADTASAHGKELWAKMQICCSHEIATLPYIPSPAHVYGKMKGAHALGVRGVMECWYFGNYPCLMSKAAGELSFLQSFDGESSRESFLHRLASILYGESAAPAVLKAWTFFERGYSQYPLNIMFSYYSPAHDSVVWELSLKPKNFSPSRSWLLLDRPDGDRICDSLLVTHTLDEAITLFTAMKEEYAQGMALLSKIDVFEGSVLADLYSVSSALYVLCCSTLNILTFYKLRDELGCGAKNAKETLDKMRQIVFDEIKRTQEMIALCEKDSRLGYHSEAEGYKFFPEKMHSRIASLEALLATEFPEIAARIENDLPPLEYYLGVEEDCAHSYTMAKKIDLAPWEYLSDHKTAFRMAADDEKIVIDLKGDGTCFILSPEFRLFSITTPITVHLSKDGNPTMTLGNKEEIRCHWPFYRPERYNAELAKWHLEGLPTENGAYRARLTIARKDAGTRANAPFKLRVLTGSGYSAGTAYWETEPNPVYSLGKGILSPGSYGWVFFPTEN